MPATVCFGSGHPDAILFNMSIHAALSGVLLLIRESMCCTKLMSRISK